jgi:hypothetical protein
MTQTFGITLLLLATLSVNLQDGKPAGACRLETKYDRFADMTTVQCDLVESGDSQARLTVQASASFRGKEPNETAKFWLSLSSNRGGATRRTKPLFREATTLYLSTDSTRLEIPVRYYGAAFYELVRSFSESARAEISREDLRKLLKVESLKGEWGGVEFEFSDAALASLKDFVSRQIFAANDR